MVRPMAASIRSLLAFDTVSGGKDDLGWAGLDERRGCCAALAEPTLVPDLTSVPKDIFFRSDMLQRAEYSRDNDRHVMYVAM